jgi:hypothetical protein
MSNFLNSYFGPLPQEYCIYFYVLSIFFGFIFVFSAIGLTYSLIVYHKKVNAMMVVNSLLLLFNTFLGYLVNRLLHTMCVKSI